MTTMTGKDIEEFEEIKQKAWEVYLHPQNVWCEEGIRNSIAPMDSAWATAERFYEYAKQKEKEMHDNGGDHFNDLIGNQLRKMMRASTMNTAVREIIHFMYNDYEITVVKQEKTDD